MAIIIAILAVVIGYLLGSIPPAYILGRVLHGVDIRTQGSGNVGGANAGRLFGKKVFAVVAIFDIFKGYAAVVVAKLLVPGNVAASGLFSSQDLFISLAAFFAIVGHCYSVWLGFSGGKGGATTAGAILAFDPLTFLILLLVWILIVGTTRFTSLGNLLGVIIIPIMFNIRFDPVEYIYLGWAIVVLIYWKHRANIGRLVRGEERKFGNREILVTEEPAKSES